MLNRRHIRIKVLQAFYAFFQSKNSDVLVGEKELFHSIEKIYDLYIFLLLLFSALKRQANIQIEEAKRSAFLRKDINVLKTGFTDNKIITVLENSDKLNKIAKDRKINWEGDVEHDLTKKLFKELYQSESYIEVFEYQHHVANGRWESTDNHVAILRRSIVDIKSDVVSLNRTEIAIVPGNLDTSVGEDRP